ncbi:MoaD/ThiS family protein [Blastopirellula marina]|uniref:Molybdopterin synthase sulfur carrier subunit n=1 Tax=Blastopirellula marina TaxID=124 RepID=A0A2S8GCY5_9BACT|nr:MoaD/ThiS family protein [Blastopirellula marina]PQO42326.1 molybdopterin converting factor subunit 1 [Blastopirellula marina]
MNVCIKLFALTRDLAGTDEVSLELDAPVTIAAVRSALGEAVPALQPVLPSCAFAVDNEYAGNTAEIEPGAEVACLPPVSGG